MVSHTEIATGYLIKQKAGYLPTIYYRKQNLQMSSISFVNDEATLYCVGSL